MGFEWQSEQKLATAEPPISKAVSQSGRWMSASFEYSESDTSWLTARMRSQLVLAFWSIAAACAVTRGFVTSLQPNRSGDLHVVYSWVKGWLWQGVSAYNPAGPVAPDPWRTIHSDYPPYAIAFLSPIALVPEQWVAFGWVIINLLLAVVVFLLAFRLFNPAAPLRKALLPGLIFLTWVGVRVGLSNGQFTLLMVFFGLTAVTIADRRPVLSGLLLGLSIIKPHVGLAFFGWMLVTKRLKPAVVSIGVVLLGTGIYAIRLGQSPLLVVQEYVGVIQMQFGTEAFASGVFELRPLVHWLVPNYSVAEFLNAAILLTTAAAILWVAVVKRRSEPRERDLLLLQLCCLWALMAVFHNPYDSILMLPVVFGLYKAAESSLSERARKTATVLLWIVQAAMIIDVAGRWRTIRSWFQLTGYESLGSLISQFDRVLVLSLFVVIAIAAISTSLAFLSPGRLRERDAAV